MRSIRIYLSAAILLPSTLIFAVVLFSLNLSSVRSADDRVLDRMQATTLTMQSDVERYVLVAVEMAKTLAITIQEEDYLPSDDIFEGILESELKELALVEMITLRRIPQGIPQMEKPGIESLLRVKKTGFGSVTSRPTLNELTTAERSVLALVDSTGEGQFSQTEEEERDKHYVTWVQPLFNRQGVHVASLMVGFGLEPTTKTFIRAFQHVLGPDTTRVRVLVTGQYGRVTYYSADPSLTGLLLEEWEERTGAGLYPLIDSLDSVEGAVVRIPDRGLIAGLRRDNVWLAHRQMLTTTKMFLWGTRNDLSPIDWAFLQQQSVALLLIFLFQVTILIFAVRRISHPLESLSNTAREIGEGGTPTIGFQDRVDELGTLARSLSTMSSELSRRSRERSDARGVDFGSLVSQLPGSSFYFRLDDKGRYSYLSESVASVLGATPEQMLGDFHIGKENPDVGLKELLVQLLKGERQETEYLLKTLHVDGTSRDLIVSLRRFTEDTLEGLEGIATDRSEWVAEKEQVEAFLAASPTAILVVDERGRIDTVNNEACLAFGYEREEFMGLDVEDLIPSERSSNHARHRQSYFQDPSAGRMKAIDLEAKRKDGSVFPAEIGLGPIRTRRGRFVIATITDISERRKAIERIEQSIIEVEQNAASRAAALNAADIGFFQLEFSSQTRVCDEGVMKVMGFLPDSPVSPETWLSAIHPDDVDRASSKFKTAIEKLEPYETEYRIIRPIDGKIGYVRETANFTGSPGQEARYLMGVVHDVTAVRTNEAKLQQLYDNPSDGVIFVTKDLEIMECNGALAQMLGYGSSVELIGKSILDFSPKRQGNGQASGEGAESITSQLVSEKNVRFEWLTTRKDGSLMPVDITISRAVYEGQECIMAVLRDISELKLAIEKADLANASKTSFLANMSHEIRTPINAILGFAEVLTEKAQSEETREYLSIIQSAGSDLLSLINDVLDLSKIEADKLNIEEEAVDLMALIRDLERLFSKQMDDKGLAFDVLVTGEPPPLVQVDRRRLRQVLTNLISNAIKFTKEGGVTVEMDTHRNDSGDGIDLVIQVKDTGIGIESSSLTRIFDSFEQARSDRANDHGGTGLGLAIAKRLVGLMGGEILVSSTLGEGTEFTVAIPNLSESDASELSDLGQISEEEIDFSPSCVLVVDDVKENRRLVVDYLKETNLLLVEAENGQAAIDKVLSHSPDLVLLDMKLPDMHGTEVIAQIHAFSGGKTLKIVGFTASVEEMNPHNDMLDDMVLKPVSRYQMMEVLSRHLVHQRVLIDASLEKDLGSSISSLGENQETKELIEASGKLRDELVTELRSRTEKVKFLLDTPVIDEIESFGEEIVVLARRCGDQHLERWAETLIGHAKMIRVRKMNRCLTEFNEHIERLS